MGKRLVTACAAIGVLTAAVVVPINEAEGARPTGLTGSLAVADCLREKNEIGKRAFRKRHGPRRAMAKCIAATAPAAQEAIAWASSACQTELDTWGLAEFLLEWESFDECVSLYADWQMDGGFVDDPDEDEE